MANSIALSKIYLSLLDAVYKEGAKTAILDGNNTLVRDGATASSILLPKTTIQGLGDYSRNNGFVNGDVVLTWETHTLTQDRGRSFQIDSMDNQETAEVAFGTLASEFLRTSVIPEVDAYRFMTMASNAGNAATPATLTKSTVGTAIDTATEIMTDAEVPQEGRLLFVSPTVYTFLKQSDLYVRNINDGNGNVNSNVGTYNNMPVIIVPQSRFYTEITLLNGGTGEEAGGYVKTVSTGKDINFMIVHSGAALGVKKHITPRVFAPDVNQDADAWKFQYRIYHDLFVPDNKNAGIYLHNKE